MMRAQELFKAIPFLKGLQRQLVAVEISAGMLKLALFKPGPKNEVAGLVSRDIRGLTDAEVSDAAAAALRELGCRVPSVALVVPTPIVISKNIEVPSTDSRELREIVNLQAARHTPFSREEIIIDYIPTGTYKQNYTKILLLIVTSAAVKKQIALLERAGIRVGKVA
jgi:Tfp pilus assembly PilM family ATPase